MKRLMIFVSSALLMLLCGAGLFAQGASYKIENPDLLAKEVLTIETQWDFYWGKFVGPEDEATAPDIQVTVPCEWNKYDLPQEARRIAKKGDGSGSYRLTLTNLKPNTEYAMPVFEVFYTASKIYANGKLIFQEGQPAEKWEKGKAEQYYTKAVFKSDSSGTAKLTIYVSNNFYRKGGFRGEFKISENEYYTKSLNRTLVAYSIFTGLLLLMILYCILLSIQKKSLSNLYLALLILGILSRLITAIFPLPKAIFTNMPFAMMLRIEYMALFLIPSSQTLYFDALNKKIFNHISAKLLAAPAIIFCILDFTLPIRYANRLVPFMQGYMFIIIGIDVVLFFIRIIKDKDLVSIMAILSLIIIALGATNDILIIHHIYILGSFKLLGLSFVLYAFFQIVLLAYLQDRNYRKVVELNEQLVETNTAYYRFVPKEFLELLSKKDITEVSLGEYRLQKMAVLSADIRNFTATSEKLEGIQVFDMLNSYLGRIAPLIRKYGGLIEKYLGDGIIAIFPESAQSALNCALEMQEEMIELRREFEARQMPAIKIGIGIHYGNVVIGTGGDQERMTEISLSQDIDIAIKTEAATKIYHRPILVTKETLAQAANEVRALGKKFDFYGKEQELLPEEAVGPAVPQLYYIYNEKTGDLL
ncbi:MAG: adenylate/guanylate cyclase domain-containing protein [Treponema sp.]|nr:adenylate/guanylate cyclase domain-containing protein [Treponema sp.]